MSEKYGFVYIWYDKKHKRYYVGCRWGRIDDGYVCSSAWMKKAYDNRPHDFKRRILKTNLTREGMYVEEQRYFDMIKIEEIKPYNNCPRYYNLSLSSKNPWHQYPESVKTVGQKISASKKGKSVPAPPGRGAAISKAKKGNPLTTAHKDALRGIKKKPHSDEWKEESSKRMKEQWSGDSKRKQAVSEAAKRRWEQFRLNTKKPAKPKRELYAPGERLKQLWADPVWAAAQREKLKIARNNRKS